MRDAGATRRPNKLLPDAISENATVKINKGIILYVVGNKLTTAKKATNYNE